MSSSRFPAALLPLLVLAGSVASVAVGAEVAGGKAAADSPEAKALRARFARVRGSCVKSMELGRRAEALRLLEECSRIHQEFLALPEGRREAQGSDDADFDPDFSLEDEPPTMIQALATLRSGLAETLELTRERDLAGVRKRIAASAARTLLDDSDPEERRRRSSSRELARRRAWEWPGEGNTLSRLRVQEAQVLWNLGREEEAHTVLTDMVEAFRKGAEAFGLREVRKGGSGFLLESPVALAYRRLEFWGEIPRALPLRREEVALLDRFLPKESDDLAFRLLSLVARCGRTLEEAPEAREETLDFVEGVVERRRHAILEALGAGPPSGMKSELESTRGTLEVVATLAGKLRARYLGSASP